MMIATTSLNVKHFNEILGLKTQIGTYIRLTPIPMEVTTRRADAVGSSTVVFPPMDDPEESDGGCDTILVGLIDSGAVDFSVRLVGLSVGSLDTVLEGLVVVRGIVADTKAPSSFWKSLSFCAPMSAI